MLHAMCTQFPFPHAPTILQCNNMKRNERAGVNVRKSSWCKRMTRTHHGGSDHARKQMETFRLYRQAQDTKNWEEQERGHPTSPPLTLSPTPKAHIGGGKERHGQ
mmetsp:Transcript_41549/g.81956  ORF Transcript_41549/g.81956 Transcript_41549/m.81956 type:complete len:105 (+) Transcript_41549:713-1027(+)